MGSPRYIDEFVWKQEIGVLPGFKTTTLHGFDAEMRSAVMNNSFQTTPIRIACVEGGKPVAILYDEDGILYLLSPQPGIIGSFHQTQWSIDGCHPVDLYRAVGNGFNAHRFASKKAAKAAAE
jgi:hypothetical protein